MYTKMATWSLRVRSFDKSYAKVSGFGSSGRYGLVRLFRFRLKCSVAEVQSFRLSSRLGSGLSACRVVIKIESVCKGL